jgi:hypothetical protein
MNRKIEEIKNDIESYLKETIEHQNKHIDYILFNPKNDDVYVLASDGYDEAIEFTPYSKNKIVDYTYVPEWDFNFDYYIYNYLEEGLKIGYMTDDVHYGIWNSISELYPTDIEYKNGVQEYLQYCKDNNITKEYLDKKTGLSTPNIMQYYKTKYVKVLENWETDYGDLRCSAILYENGKAKAYIIASYEENLGDIDYLIGCDFEEYLKLPKISKCSKLLQKVYDNVCQSTASICYISKEDWNKYYTNFNDKDIEKLKEDIKKYYLEDVVTIDNHGFKIVGWGDLETRFNDDRKLEKNKNKDRER